jgi:hypothetical protein
MLSCTVAMGAKGVKQPSSKPRKPRNQVRADIYRRMKLGDETFDKLKGTSLDSAAEKDELIRLNCGAPEGGHTEPVKQLVDAAVAGKSVSAVEYTKSGAAYRREGIPDTKGRNQPARKHKPKPTEADQEAWDAGDISRAEAESRGIDTSPGQVRARRQENEVRRGQAHGRGGRGPCYQAGSAAR